MEKKSCDLFGCSIDSLTMEQTIDRVEMIIKDGTPKQHVVVNVAKIVNMQKDQNLLQILNSCDMVNADGMPIVWASRILSKPLPCRVAGIDLFQKLVELSNKRGYRPFFFGARETVVTEVVKIFRQKYPKLKVAGFRNGYFSKSEEAGIANMIRESEADMLFVGFSSPMKERFLNEWMRTMQIPFCMGVGGGFDIVAGVTKRAPFWMQEYGMEWFYRFLQEPRRMWKRYVTTNPVFLWMVIKEYLKRQKDR